MSHPVISLVGRQDGVVEIWRVDPTELLGEISPTADGIRLVMGDVDPPDGAALCWTGEPFAFELRVPAKL